MAGTDLWHCNGHWSPSCHSNYTFPISIQAFFSIRRSAHTIPLFKIDARQYMSYSLTVGSAIYFPSPAFFPVLHSRLVFTTWSFLSSFWYHVFFLTLLYFDTIVVVSCLFLPSFHPRSLFFFWSPLIHPFSSWLFLTHDDPHSFFIPGAGAGQYDC